MSRSLDNLPLDKVAVGDVLFCASLRRRHAHGHVTRSILCVEITRKNCGGHFRETRFVRACTVEMHMDISQEEFCVEIYRESAARASGTPILCEPGQAKCTWNHVVWKFIGHWPDTVETTSIKQRT